MLPEFETFLTPERVDQFWENVKWLMFFVAPIVMIFFAADIIGSVISMIKKALGIQKEKDDDDYDIYRY